jgi:hypothetical protein
MQFPSGEGRVSPRDRLENFRGGRCEWPAAGATRKSGHKPTHHVVGRQIDCRYIQLMESAGLKDAPSSAWLEHIGNERPPSRSALVQAFRRSGPNVISHSKV